MGLFLAVHIPAEQQEIHLAHGGHHRYALLFMQ